MIERATSSAPRLVRFGDVVSRVREQVQVHPTSTYLELGIRSHGKGVFHKEAVLGAKLGEKAVFRVVPNCLVFNIIFAWEGAVAATSTRDEGRVASHRFPMFRVDESVADLEYLRLFLLSNRGLYLLRLASPGGAGRNRTLSLQELLDTRLPLPGVAAQRSAARTATTCSRHERSLGRQVEAKRRLKRALLQQLLNRPGADSRTVGELCTVTYGTSQATRNGGGVPVIGMQHIRDGQLVLKDLPLAHVASREVETLTLREGDILFNRTNSADQVGKSALFAGGFGRPIVFASYLVRLRPDIAIVVPKYLSEVLSHPAILQRIRSTATKGVSQCNINPTRFAATFRVPLQPPNVQRAVADVATTIDHEIALLDRQLAAYCQLKRGLMQRLLTGDVAIPTGPSIAAPEPIGNR